MPGPALAIGRGGEKLLDQFLVGLGAGVGGEGENRLRRRCEPGEIERRAPQELDPVGVRLHLEPRGLEPSRHESIDHIACQGLPRSRL